MLMPNSLVVKTENILLDTCILKEVLYLKLSTFVASKVGWAKRDHRKERICTIYIVSFCVIVGITFLAILSFIDTNRISI